MNRLSRFAALASAVAFACTASLCPAQGINIDFEGTAGVGLPGTGVPANTFGGAANQPGAWNRVFAATPVPLNDLTGAASGVTISRLGGGIAHTGFANPNTAGEFELLFDDYWATNAVAFTVRFTGLNPGWYEVYTYAINPAPLFPATSLVTVAGAAPIPTQQSGGAMPLNSFDLGVTHTLHRVLVPAAGILDLTLVAPFGSGGVGGMQLKPVDPCPEVDITSPANFACICDSATVIGDVTAQPPGAVAFWFLQYRELNALNWTLINFGFNSGLGLNLGNFNTAGLSHGYHFLKLTAYGLDGCIDEDTHIVFVDKMFENLALTSPITGEVYGGTVCIAGIVNDQCLDAYTVQWAPLPAGMPLMDVDPGMPFYTTQIYNAVTFATWDTTGLAIPDGDYQIVVTAKDICGYDAVETRDITVDNTPPTAEITSPGECEYVDCDSVDIFGTVQDPNLSGWILQVIGGPYINWTTIASGNTNIGPNGLLGTWNTTGLPFCAYTLRLIATDSALIDCNGAIAQQTIDHVGVIVGLEGDTNGDGVLDFDDIVFILANWLQSCP